MREQNHTQLTVQYRRRDGRWEDKTRVFVFESTSLPAALAELVAELPAGIAARVRVVTPEGAVSYTW